MIWKCQQEGMSGIVVTVPRTDPIYDAGTHVYQLLVGGKLAFFTGNQMVSL
tara:strand:- start:105 stop:257 length:153 start_codon:yes stop_codon:yes gene_type:complete